MDSIIARKFPKEKYMHAVEERTIPISPADKVCKM